MIIFPAIDIQEGKVVRLVQGQFDQVTRYAHDPVTIAQQWESQGATWLHVVDLDGAKTGQAQNTDVILAVAQAVNIPVQVGGGLRDEETIVRLLEGNIQRVILGTKMIEDLDFLKTMLKNWPGRLAVSLDCSQGYLAQRGWTSTSNIKATDFVKELESIPLPCLVYTDIARDGMLKGPHWEGIQELLQSTNIPVIASGGVASLEDVAKLSQWKNQGLLGAIIGKALYEKKIDLKEAIETAS